MQDHYAAKLICRSIDGLTKEIRRLREIEERREASQKKILEDENGSGTIPPPFALNK